MSSELAVITAEIVDILPREQQTPAMEKWVGDQLSQGNSVSDLLAYCKDSFGIVAHKIEAVESKLARQGVMLDNHIKYTDQRFEAVNNKVSELQTQLAVTTALSNERSQQQQFTNGQLMSSINNTNSNLTNGLTNVSKSRGSGETNYVTLAFSLAFGVILLSCMAALANKPSQTIEYKNVPSAGHPQPIPKELYDKI